MRQPVPYRIRQPAREDGYRYLQLTVLILENIILFYSRRSELQIYQHQKNLEQKIFDNKLLTTAKNDKSSCPMRQPTPVTLIATRFN